MKIVKTNLTGKLSLEDHVFNDAMETAALKCDDDAHALRSANGGDESWVWPAAKFIANLAAEFRAQKREPV